MVDKKFILVAIAVLVIVLGAVLVLFTSSDNNATNATNNTLNVTENPGNITAEVIKDNTKDVNKTSNANNSSLKASGNDSNVQPGKAGWKWSEQLQTYTNEFVDSEGNLHIQLIGADGHVQELIYMTDGSVFSGGVNITKQYHESFS